MVEEGGQRREMEDDNPVTRPTKVHGRAEQRAYLQRLGTELPAFWMRLNWLPNCMQVQDDQYAVFGKWRYFILQLKCKLVRRPNR